jgi:hypothetical protein
MDVMDLRPRLLLTLEFDVNAEPMRGRVRDGDGDGDGDGEWFSGWMGLTRTIELALAAAHGSDATTPAEQA